MCRMLGACAAVAVCVAATGCPEWPGGRLIPVVPEQKPQTLRAKSPTGFDRVFGETPVEGLYVESLLIERPVGDAYMDQALWSEGRTPLAPESEAILAENGIRVVVLGGNLPPQFQKLLQSETDTVNPHALTFASREEAVLPTVGPVAECQFEVLTDLAGERSPVDLQQARGGVLVRPRLSADGRIQVRCEPRIQHGERQDWIRPTSDGTQFVMKGELPVERYPGLRFEVLLGAGEYLVIGWPASSGRTLGSALFSVDAAGRARQRTLVIRAGWRGDRPGGLPIPSSSRLRPPVAVEAARR